MTEIATFKNSLQNNSPDKAFSASLKALWYDAKGDWDRAHSEVDHLNDQEAAHVHAYLHRKEGDIFNADYWYRRAGKVRPDLSLNEEWEQLVEEMIDSASPQG